MYSAWSLLTFRRNVSNNLPDKHGVTSRVTVTFSNCWDKLRLNIYLRKGTDISAHPLIPKPELPWILTDLNGLRRLRALKTPESKIETKDKNSEGDEKVGKTSGEGLLYTDLKCLTNSSAT
jgi:hypothetical protein